MLPSTGYFRSLDCPFYAEARCQRPHCHFKHPRSARNKAGSERRAAEVPGSKTESKDDAYDPSHPGLLEKLPARNVVATQADDLEAVTRAIEAVKNAMEQEKQKLSRCLQDRKLTYAAHSSTVDEYDPTAVGPELLRGNVFGPKHVGFTAGSDLLKNNEVSFRSAALEYDPADFSLSKTVEYNPTPITAKGRTKYTLDSPRDEDPSHYVPKVVACTQQVAPSNKYVVDIKKPTSNMEYDPLMNFTSMFTPEKESDSKQQKKRHRSSDSRAADTVSYEPSPKDARVATPASNGMGDNSPFGAAPVEGPPCQFSDEDDNDGDDDGAAVVADDNGDSSSNKEVPQSGVVRKVKVKKRAEPVLREIAVQCGIGGLSRGDDDNSGKVQEKENHSRLKADRKIKDKSPLEKQTSSGSSKLTDKIKVSSKLEKNPGLSKGAEVEKSRSLKTKEIKISSKDKSCSSSKGDKDKGSNNKSDKHKNSESAHSSSNSTVRTEKNKASKGDTNDKKSETVHATKAKDDDKHKHSSKDRKPHLKSRDKKERKSSSSEKEGRSHDNQRQGKDSALKPHKDGGGTERGHKASKKRKDGNKEDKPAVNLPTRNPAKEKRNKITQKDLFGDDSEDEDQSVASVSTASLVSKSLKRPLPSSSGSIGGHLKRPKLTSPIRGVESDIDDSDGGDGDDNDDDDDDDEIDYAAIASEMDFEESDPMEECLRIFNESTEIKKEDKGRRRPSLGQENVEEGSSGVTPVVPLLKKRVAHTSKFETAKPGQAVIRPYRPTAQQVCQARLLQAQQRSLTAAPAPASLPLAASPATAARPAASPSTSPFGGKRRVAHGLFTTSLAAGARGAVSVNASAGRQAGTAGALTPRQVDATSPAHTPATMMCKTTVVPQRRMAHTPNPSNPAMKRPLIMADRNCKVPLAVRQRYLNVFIDECLKFCSSEQEAFDRALAEEKVAMERSSSKAIYVNVAVNVLKKLRSQGNPSPTRAPAMSLSRRPLSHEAVLGGKMAAKASFTMNLYGKGQPLESHLDEKSLFQRLSAYLLTEEQLRENGYPRPDPERCSRAILFTADTKTANKDPLMRICCRCGTSYSVNLKGDYLRREECTYHYGRAWRQRVSGGWETRYNCCQGSVGSSGCQVAKCHVFDGRKESLDGFVCTIAKSPVPDRIPGVYALDCEMCYTKQGLELTRVTVVDWQLKPVYDTFVLPDSEVVDYNTRFSGVTEEDLRDTTTTIRTVQAALLSRLSADSILLGHSLESDLFALKIIHSTVVDTAVVFPHRMGSPYKRALRTLMAEHLQRIIQNDVGGHNSTEDAASCMELMIYKIKEDAKVKK
ncbi:RNA exonuclease 1 homolog isoform X1 [Petromyzon marinus]|uniref:RNA exonuclease 1 homolog isoform X1 n=1 Tax=Petromyzon marinus TaxID=7757 RepID=UPI003F717DF3